MKLLKSITDEQSKFVKIEGLINVSMNVLFDSELEARFIEAIRRYKGGDCLPVLRKQLVNKKPGYFSRFFVSSK